ncbi:MAG TPA: FAD-dependent oxidoreductase [Gemmatimonadaceae bacterium]|nr:FAD-dependent oxidoreductase [Gemmatimonadaceae bacterium]
MSDPIPRNVVAFPRLSDSQIDTLAQAGTRRHFHDGEPLFEAGGSRNAFYVILDGAVEVIDHSGAAPRTVTVHHPGEFTGDIDLLSQRHPVVSAVARGETDVLEIAPADIRQIIAERPALGEVILRAFVARRSELLGSGFQGVRVMGPGSSRDTYRLLEFLSRNQIPATWIDTEEDPGVAELLRHLGLDEHALPAVACPGQPLLRNPSTRELAAAVGVKRPIGSDVYDMVIIGAGPAGLAAAVYGSSEGLRTLVLDSSAPGGQAGASMKIENYLGFPMGITGAELTSRATLQAQKFDTRISTPSSATGLERSDAKLVVRLDDDERANARCVLIATGAEYRRLDAPGRERFEGLGVYYAATPTELDACGTDEVVVIVGAGNSAGQAAVFLSEHTPRVLMLVREGDLRASMSSYLAERIEEAENIEIWYRTEIRRMDGAERLERIETVNTQTGETHTVATPAVFIFIGAVPCSAWLPPEVERDERGYIRTGRAVAKSPRWTMSRPPFLLETSMPGVFAAGDVRLGSVKRVASAVGEGAMAVSFVHAYLAEGEARQASVAAVRA